MGYAMAAADSPFLDCFGICRSSYAILHTGEKISSFMVATQAYRNKHTESAALRTAPFYFEKIMYRGWGAHNDVFCWRKSSGESLI